MAWEVCYISGLNTGTISNINGALAISGWQNNVPWENYMSDLGDNIANGVTQNTETDIWSNNDWRMTLTWSNNGNVAIKVYKNNVIFTELCSNGNLKAPCYIGFLINEDTQEGFCLTCALQYSRGYPAESSSGTNNLIYQFLKQNPIISYQWSSVPAISGKNGILSLATLKASKINDGEAVSDGSASDFSSLPSSSKISVLVAAVMPEDPGNKTSVVVTYYIGSLESGEYTSAKVAAKKNSIPESLEDADVVMDIPAESGKYSVGSLEELTKYYFVIFVADSNGNNATSNPESIRTGEIVAPFREEVVVEKKTGDDQYTLVYTWTGKWGKQDDTIVEGFEVSTFDVLLEESQLIENFEESYAENNWISEAQDTEIQT